jgi:hypothetical protein
VTIPALGPEFDLFQLCFELAPSSFKSLEEIVCDFCYLGIKSDGKS